MARKRTPPELFFHVVVLPDGRDRAMALAIHLAYEQGQQLGLTRGRRYLVNAYDEADATAQVERLERQIAEHDIEHATRYDGEVWQVGLVVAADPYLHARRDPDPSEQHEAWTLDPERADARRERQVQAGLG